MRRIVGTLGFGVDLLRYFSIHTNSSNRYIQNIKHHRDVDRDRIEDKAFGVSRILLHKIFGRMLPKLELYRTEKKTEGGIGCESAQMDCVLFLDQKLQTALFLVQASLKYFLKLIIFITFRKNHSCHR